VASMTGHTSLASESSTSLIAGWLTQNNNDATESAASIERPSSRCLGSLNIGGRLGERRSCYSSEIADLGAAPLRGELWPVVVMRAVGIPDG
jgi:hypothetical protein